MIDVKMTISLAAAFLQVTEQAIHKRLKSAQLPYQKKQNKIFFSYETARELFQLQTKVKKKVVSFQNLKGGVGKTGLSFETAVCTSLLGLKTGLIDLDKQGNVTKSCNINASTLPVMIDVLKDNISIQDAMIKVAPGLDLLPSRLANAILDNYLLMNSKSFPIDRVYIDLFSQLLETYDILYVDCPSDLNQNVAAISLASDLVVIPVVPDEYSIDGLDMITNDLGKLKNTFKKNIPYRIVFNKFDSRKYLSNTIFSDLLKNEVFSEHLYKTIIKISEEFPKAISDGQSIFSSLKSSSSAKDDILLLTKEILDLDVFENASKEN